MTQTQSNPTRLVHRLLYARYGITPQSVLNKGGEFSDGQAREFTAEVLFRLAGALEVEAVSDGGQVVDYAGLQSSVLYSRYRSAAGCLPQFDLSVLRNSAEQLAFWLNLYNALALDAVIQFGVRESVHEVKGFFWRAAYTIGGFRFSLNDIEHGVLRANRPYPAIPGPHFASEDCRRRFSLSQLDPRIHFALVCASRSCPPISAFSPHKIDEQLGLAAQNFINHGGVEVDREVGEVRLSKIFQWYAVDFGGRPLALGSKTPLLTYIAPYLVDEGDRRFLLSGRPKVRFLDYDWKLNNVSSG